MADTATGWSDDRVELLARLWAEGLSASQIAAQLGGGVTRNAVIGKVHRLGLSGRAKSGQSAAQRPAKPRAPASPPPAAEWTRSTPQSPAGQEASRSAVERVREQDIAIPVSARVSILDLRDSMCRWPLGDPTSPDFGFCGGKAATGLPYCSAHCRIAFQPVAERKRLRA